MSEEAGWEDAAALASVALSVLGSSALIVGSHRRPGVASLGLLIAADSLLGQGLPLVLHRGSCLLLASLSLFFLILLIAAMACLSASYSFSLPIYFHLLVPPTVAFCTTIPFAFPQIAVSKYFYSRQTCGFISLSYVNSSSTFIIGFVFPFCTLYYFSMRIYFQIYNVTVIQNEQRVIIFVSLCSVLLIPHIILINITHFSVSLVKVNIENKIMSSNIYETIFIWCRYSFNFITPIVIMYAQGNTINDLKHLYYLCYYSKSVTKYLKKKNEFQLLSAQKHTPILFLMKDDLMLCVNNNIKYIDVPYNCEGLKGDSSLSIELSTFSQEKHISGKKKIVRFANSVKEITMKNNEWNSDSD